MSIDLVRGELERLFTLDEMTSLTNDLLGLDPNVVGGAASKASFARALTDHCLEVDAFAALVDAIVASRKDADAKLRSLRASGVAAAVELKAGDTFGNFTITRKLGDGPNGATYAAKADGHDKVLKILAPATLENRAAVRRFVTHMRLIASVSDDHLTNGLEAGFVGRNAYVAYDHVEGQPLGARIARTGPLHINEAKNLLRGVLAGLSALHEKGFAHGAVKIENVLVSRGSDGQPRAVLVDASGGFLNTPSDAGPWGSSPALKAKSPEQLRGKLADSKSDLFGFGALLFEILSGKTPYTGETGVEVAVAALTQPAPALSSLAPRGWVAKEIDELAERLLARSPAARPAHVAEILAVIDALGKAAKDAKKTLPDGEVTERIDALVADPTSNDAALALESAVELGAEPGKVADAFSMAADLVEEGEDDDAKEKAKDAKKGLLFRAARLFEAAKNPGRAEESYAAIVGIDGEDEIALTALEELRRVLGKHEELVEMLLERSEKAKDPAESARALHQIGQLYVRELEDKEQGVFIFAQALSKDAENSDYATDLERAAGEDMKLWGEALQILSQATTNAEMPTDAKVALFVRLGHWYSEKVARPDMGLPCFQAVLAVDPAHDDALDGMAKVYRRAQQWQELGQVVLRRADRAATPAEARNFRAEAADLLETKLGDAERARDLYEQVFNEDPGHLKAAEALSRIYQKLEDHAGYAKILERKAEALRGDEHVETLCKIAELYEDRLDDLPEATRRYEAVLREDAMSLTALRGLDRIYSRGGRYKELLENLEQQIHVSATPRQKIKLYERIAGIQDEEYLNHEKAAEAYESILKIDSAHEGALSALVRHYRALDRWDDVASLYERHLKIVTDDKRHIELLLALGRVLQEQVGSPERARIAYERVLELDSNHARALESLAIVRAATGDATAALSAVEALASKAETPEAKSDLWIRAARMLEDKGDRDAAIERYKAALDVQPNNGIASQALRAAYLGRGDATSAVELIVREIEQVDGNLAKARLYGEMATLCRSKLKDNKRAADAARKAVDLDPTSMMGLMVTGDLAFEEEHFLEAAKSYESLANRVDAMPKEDGVRLLMRYIDALAKSGSTEKAIGTVKTLLALAPDDPAALIRAARVDLDAGRAEEAAKLYTEVTTRFGADLDGDTKAEVMLNLGNARRLAGDLEGAVGPLLEAADLAPESAAPIEALAKLHEARGDWEEVVRIKTRRLDVVAGDERTDLLLEIGEILAAKIGDRTRAAKSLVAALDERPDDRKVLTRLMQLYSEEKDWSKLVDVVVKLAAMVDDVKHKAKYMHTAAIVMYRQVGDLDRAAQLYDEVLTLDPSLDKALNEAIDVQLEKSDWDGADRLYKAKLERAQDQGDHAKLLATFVALGALYKDKIGSTADAIDAYEAAHTLDPDNAERQELLADLYASDPEQYLDKAIAAQAPLIRRNPYKPDAYKLLRKLYTDSKQADSAWCLCQALFCMSLAEPDEERFFKRMRSETAAAAQDRLNNEDWLANVMHPDADPLVTAIFTLIEPAVLRKSGQPLETLGYQMAYALDLAMHPYPMSQTIYYAAGVLGTELPLTFQNPNDPGGVSFLHAHQPGIVLGAAALAADIPTQAAAFIAARHLTYYRPGLYIRHLVPTGTGLRAWLFAAIKLTVPNFPIAAEMEGAVAENQKAIEGVVVGPARDQLGSAVTKLLQGGAIDLKKWVSGVDLSADRAGFIVSNDLELSHEMIKAGDEAAAALPQKERLKELTLFGVSENYFEIRRRLGINIDA